MTGPDLDQALDDLVAAALVAGADPERARTEGTELAAAVAESAPGAYLDWNSQTGTDRSGAQAFFDAASRGRRWRSGPTVQLQELLAASTERATRYAQALAAVSQAAIQLGTPDPRIAGNAAVAAAAQLSALPRPGPTQTGLRDPAAPALPSGPASPVSAGLGQPAAPAAPAETPEPAESPEPPKSLEDLLAELDALIGLADVKAEIHRQAAVLRVEALRTKAGLKAPTITRHLVFVGNPGTGKTTVARLVGGIYRALGFLSKGHLVEVDRSELVAGYLGQTAIKTAEVVASAAGGVLFIDEAYSLAGDQYGTEAVDTLVKEMEDRRDDLVLIVAGYPGPMALFIAQNPGLSSRFRTTIEFPDYTDDELAAIFATLAQKADYDAGEDCLTRFRTVLAVTPRGPTFGNGRFARNMLEAAIGRHAWRLRDVAEPTVEQLRRLLPDDLDESAGDEPRAEHPSDSPGTDASPDEEGAAR